MAEMRLISIKHSGKKVHLRWEDSVLSRGAKNMEVV